MAARNMFRELSRGSRTSSPQADEYATASSFDVNGDDQVLHSTQIMNNNTNSTAVGQVPPTRNNHSAEPSEDGSEGMSIELGRGVKGSARRNDDDLSFTGMMGFSMENSDYEVTTTPPRRPSQHKGDSKLRKEATTRRASQATQQREEGSGRAFSNARPRQLSEALAQQSADNNSSLGSNDFPQQTVTFNGRNTRFTKSRNPSAQGNNTPRRGEPTHTIQQTPRRAVTANATVQSDGQSWALPDTANIDRIIGKPKAATPGLHSAKSRSRFTSAGYKPQYARLEGVPIPQEEKAIFASLQILQDRYADLETEHAETQRRAEEYETQVIDLQNQVKVEQRLRRPDSALGSDEETAQTKWKVEKTQLQASVESLQQRLAQAERKAGVTSTQLQNVTMERDELVLRCGQAEQDNEELEAENEEFRQANGTLQDSNDQLREQIALLKQSDKDLRSVLAEYKDVRGESRDLGGEGESNQQHRAQRRPKGGNRESDSLHLGQQRKRSMLEDTDTSQRDASIGQETKHNVLESVQRQLDGVKGTRWTDRTRLPRKAGSAPGSAKPIVAEQYPSRTNSEQRVSGLGMEKQRSMPKRSVSAPIESDASEAPTTTELEITSRTQDKLRRQSQAAAKRASQIEDTRDITMLSSVSNEVGEIGSLRKALEEERVERKHSRHPSATVEPTQQGEMTGTAKQQRFAPRKSSLKDLTAGLDAGTYRMSIHDDEQLKNAKAVRIQSPHTSDTSEHAHKTEEEDVGNVSTMSNTSRRRSAIEARGKDETSGFILDDITMHKQQLEAPQAKRSHPTAITHDKTACTQCPGGNENKSFPSPIPVTDRDLDDLTNNTIRPSEPPPTALAKVIKQLEDEVIHLKLQQQKEINLYHQHDPALSMRRRLQLRASIDKFTSEIEMRSNQIYALYDVLEGQKAAGDLQGKGQQEPEVEETLQSVGMDAAEIAGRVGRSAPPNLGGLDGMMDELSDGEELPWEGLSDVESEAN